jgi:hypothetical protein
MSTQKISIKQGLSAYLTSANSYQIESEYASTLTAEAAPVEPGRRPEPATESNGASTITCICPSGTARISHASLQAAPHRHCRQGRGGGRKAGSNRVQVLRRRPAPAWIAGHFCVTPPARRCLSFTASASDARAEAAPTNRAFVHIISEPNSINPAPALSDSGHNNTLQKTLPSGVST